MSKRYIIETKFYFFIIKQIFNKEIFKYGNWNKQNPLKFRKNNAKSNMK